MRTRSLMTVVLLAALAPAVGLAHDTPMKVEGPADDYVYELAAPGSYALPRIRQAADAELLDESGKTLKLSGLFSEGITILAFMYTRCGDVCPLAALRLADFQMLASGQADVAGQVQLVSLSFDPDYDTPQVMSKFAGHMRMPDVSSPPWLFLTASSKEAIAPVLKAYNQPVARKSDPNDPSGPLSHLLRVFLVDSDGFVRNIYSSEFLDPRLLLNDVRSLQMNPVPKP